MVFMERLPSHMKGRVKLSRVFADSPDELERVAHACDLLPEWKQYAGTPREHYTLSVSKRKLVQRFGVILLSAEEITARLQERASAHEGMKSLVDHRWELVTSTARELVVLADVIGGQVSKAGYRHSFEQWATSVLTAIRKMRSAQAVIDQAVLDELDRKQLQQDAQQDAQQDVKKNLAS